MHVGIVEATRIAVELYPVQLYRQYSDKARGACWLGALELGGFERVLYGLCECPGHGRLTSVVVQRECPDCRELVPGCYESLGIHLNDTHEWTREAISLYLSRFEERVEEPAFELALVGVSDGVDGDATVLR